MLGFLKKLFGVEGTEGVEEVEQDDFPSEIRAIRSDGTAQRLPKEATRLKVEKKYDEAVDKLREAILESGNQDLTVKDHLRLPMYLLLAGKGEEGWAVLSDLDSKHRHAVSQVEIADQMRVFLMKDGRPKEAAFYAVWALCKEIERDRWLLRGIEKKADKLANNPSLASRYAGREVFATTPNQNPIRDSFYLTIKQRIEEGCTTSEVDRVLRPILKKAKMEDRVSEISRVAAAYLGSRMRYDLKSLQKVIGHFLV